MLVVRGQPRDRADAFGVAKLDQFARGRRRKRQRRRVAPRRERLASRSHIGLSVRAAVRSHGKVDGGPRLQLCELAVTPRRRMRSIVARRGRYVVGSSRHDPPTNGPSWMLNGGICGDAADPMARRALVPYTKRAFLGLWQVEDQAKHQGAVRGAPFETAGDAVIADSPIAQSV
jgi:hypothetical protein